MPNFSGKKSVELEMLAKRLLENPVPGRGVEQIFITIANAWQEEKRITCKIPNVPLSLFGRMLGLSKTQIERGRRFAESRSESVRRIGIGGAPIAQYGGTRRDWVTETGERVMR